MTHGSHPWTRRAVIAALAATGAGGVARAEDLPWQLTKLRSTRVHGHHIAYYEAGSGPPLVLVHGGSGSPALEFGRVIRPLSRKYRVLVPYQIGFAPSDQPDLPYDASTFVDYLGGFMGSRRAEGATLVGESFGGWVVAQYALRQGQKSSWGQILPLISHLVIVDGAVQVRPGEGGGGPQDSINSPTVATLARAFYNSQPHVDNSAVMRAVGPHMLAQQLSDAQLKGLQTPTLVIWGREDKLLSQEHAHRIADQVPGARAVIIGECGHIPSVEQPRAFVNALSDFLASS